MEDGTWGDHVILHGAANCFQTCIHVISSLPHRHDVMVCPEFDVTGSNRLVLGHVHELHYVSLIPQKGGKDVWLYCDSRVANSRYEMEYIWPLLWPLVCKLVGRKKRPMFSHVQFFNPSILLLLYTVILGSYYNSKKWSKNFRYRVTPFWGLL